MRPGDLLGRAFPSGDWGEPAERLDELFQWVEEYALGVVSWYLADRVAKRRWARLLRLGTVAGLAAGGLLPLLRLADVLGPSAPTWGYVGLLGAVLCAGTDRMLGLTSGWMRDVGTAHAVRRRLTALQYDWAAERVREVLGPVEGTGGEAAERSLALLRRFAEDVEEIVRDETVDWMVEFRTRALSGPLHAGRREGGTDGSSGGGAGLPVRPAPPRPGGGPGLRPRMPRQRPPEG
ncbi:SLATT domain-containing protein [Streptomyces sp. SB3404]|uniref:SLATT domain-containing protein n=2 Tax=Streptomyces boncukensis TaxID=2711219 RepID=A0A6G4X9Q3_9ACTN|nr:SLATT domain-containing protein [Streptomyces boncukensis]NGO73391.1 SLATT domain-containing protein [Streptomyces boncukensis]